MKVEERLLSLLKNDKEVVTTILSIINGTYNFDDEVLNSIPRNEIAIYLEKIIMSSLNKNEELMGDSFFNIVNEFAQKLPSLDSKFLNHRNLTSLKYDLVLAKEKMNKAKSVKRATFILTAFICLNLAGCAKDREVPNISIEQTEDFGFNKDDILTKEQVDEILNKSNSSKIKVYKDEIIPDHVTRFNEDDILTKEQVDEIYRKYYGNFNKDDVLTKEQVEEQLKNSPYIYHEDGTYELKDEYKQQENQTLAPQSELTNEEKIGVILERENITREQFDIICAIVRAEALSNSYEDGYAVTSTLYNHIHDKEWISTCNSLFNNDVGTNIYYQAICPTIFEVYDNGMYLNHLGIKDGPVYQSIIDCLYTRHPSHDFLNFRSPKWDIPGSIQFVENGNKYFNPILEENRVADNTLNH